jgi:hypothetical protein
MRTLDECLELGANIRDDLMAGYLRGVIAKCTAQRFAIPVERERLGTHYGWTFEKPHLMGGIIKLLRCRCSNCAFGIPELARVREMLLVFALTKIWLQFSQIVYFERRKFCEETSLLSLTFRETAKAWH